MLSSIAYTGVSIHQCPNSKTIRPKPVRPSASLIVQDMSNHTAGQFSCPASQSIIRIPGSPDIWTWLGFLLHPWPYTSTSRCMGPTAWLRHPHPPPPATLYLCENHMFHIHPLITSLMLSIEYWITNILPKGRRHAGTFSSAVSGIISDFFSTVSLVGRWALRSYLGLNDYDVAIRAQGQLHECTESLTDGVIQLDVHVSVSRHGNSTLWPPTPKCHITPGILQLQVANHLVPGGLMTSAGPVLMEQTLIHLPAVQPNFWQIPMAFPAHYQAVPTNPSYALKYHRIEIRNYEKNPSLLSWLIECSWVKASQQRWISND